VIRVVRVVISPIIARKESAERREQRAESREQRADSREEHRAESR
jgi:hypothetical protein